jgi:hypothetical protein
MQNSSLYKAKNINKESFITSLLHDRSNTQSTFCKLLSDEVTPENFFTESI